jgi:hypothetical protein
MAGGWDDLEAVQLDNRDAMTKADDLNKLCLRVLGSEEGQKLLKWLDSAYLDQPVAVPGSDASYAYYREGQNSVIRDLMMRLIKARNP